MLRASLIRLDIHRILPRTLILRSDMTEEAKSTLRTGAGSSSRGRGGGSGTRGRGRGSRGFASSKKNGVESIPTTVAPE
jgi:hypothetical protein